MTCGQEASPDTLSVHPRGKKCIGTMPGINRPKVTLEIIIFVTFVDYNHQGELQ